MDMMAPRRCNRFRQSCWDTENERRAMFAGQLRLDTLANGYERTDNDPNQKHAFSHYTFGPFLTLLDYANSSHAS